MKYKVRDRVRIKSIDWYNKNKNSAGYIRCGKELFIEDMSEYCGQIATIIKIIDKEYRLNIDDGCWNWIDDMFEGLVEEEIIDIDDFQDDNEMGDIIDECVHRLKDNECFMVRPEGYIFKDENGNGINATKIVLEKLVGPKFKKGDKIKDKNNRVWYVEQVGNKHFDISRIPNGGSGYFVPIEDQDYYELVPDRELPKTYEACCKVLGCKPIVGFAGLDDDEENLYGKFIALKRCRDAYWKLYGEEMGLGKPWEPDWNTSGPKYVIAYTSRGIEKQWETTYCKCFAFPTEEMRDEFKENFDRDLETCKELL